MWIKRDISDILQKNTDLVQILIGPRQTGKSSLLSRISTNYFEISLDDLHSRELANSDPEQLYALAHGQPLLIDEAQLAPEIFYFIKRKVDQHRKLDKTRKNLFRLTGSNQIFLDKNVKESLAGRASFYEMTTLSVSEILRSQNLSISEILFRGGWPELYIEEKLNIMNFLDDYINSYLEKDIVLSAGIQKQRDFLQLCKLLAARTGTLLNSSEIGSEVGVEQSTIRDWISILEKMKIISLVPSYTSNLTNRLVKRPKIYFLDTGLAVHLQGWNNATAFLLSPASGHMFENLVFTEIYKTIKNFKKNWTIYHWRSRDGEEIDFFIEGDNQKKLLIEVKKSPQNPKDYKNFPEIKKTFKTSPPPLILVHMEGSHPLKNVLAISRLKEELLSLLS